MEGSPAAEEANGAAAAPQELPKVSASSVDTAGAADLTDQVRKLKVVLENKAAPSEELLEGLTSLRQLGSLPVKVLSETMIGKTVNQLHKGSADAAVVAKAKDLDQYWRQEHRKRKPSTASLDGEAPPKRTASSVSLPSEAPASQGIEQASPMNRSQSLTSLTRMDSKEDQSTDVASLRAGAKASKCPKGHRLEKTSVVMRTRCCLCPREMLKEELWGCKVCNPNWVSCKDCQNELRLSEYTELRQTVLSKFSAALAKEEEVEDMSSNSAADPEMRDPKILASEIDEALHKAFEDVKDYQKTKDSYMTQSRAILYNLKDAKNKTFRWKLMVGFWKPEDTPKLTAEDMASDEKNAEREKQRKYAMEEIQTDWAIKNGGMRITGMFTCGKCKGVKTTYFQMQTRSSDEPMTTFVTCLTCNNRWKFC